ncbi:hypothetical protein KUV57_11200 [Epibacterium sp. DP7N7-1]|nr:hypothetical protein [Epibacterium sp. DP7N7-1]
MLELSCSTKIRDLALSEVMLGECQKATEVEALFSELLEDKIAHPIAMTGFEAVMAFKMENNVCL